MGVVFWLFSYATGYVSILLLALSISSGLYLLAELAEEYPTLTGKVIRYLSASIVVLHFILWLDGMPLYQSIVGLLSHAVYATMLRSYPFVQLYSIVSFLAVLAFFGSNIIWLQYFVDGPAYETLQIMGFYVVMVWAVPCALFISVSLGESTLPVSGGPIINDNNGINNLTGGRNKSFFRGLFDYVLSVLDNLSLGVMFSREGRSKRLH